MVQVLERYSDSSMPKDKSAKKVKKRRQSSKSERSEKEQSMQEVESGTPASPDIS